MALITATAEPELHIVGFTGGMVPLNISPRMRLDRLLKEISHLPFERTDCAQPMF